MIASIFQGLVLGLSAAASPGPFQTFVISQALKLGWRRTLPAALAPLISDGPIVALVLLVLSNLPASFIRFVQVAGGIFVLYLAWKSFRSFQDFQFTPPALGHEERKNLIQAVGTNFLSPGPYLFWSLLAGPILVESWLVSPALGVSFISGFYAALVGGLALIIVVFGTARRLGPRVNRVLIGLSTLALFGFGFYQLWRGLNSG